MNHIPTPAHQSATREGLDIARHHMLTHFRWALLAGIPREELAQEIEATASAMRKMLDDAG